MNTTPARRRFRALIRNPEPQINLAEAAICIAWEDRGSGDPRSSLHELDVLAATAHARIAGADSPHTIIAALNTYLFSDLGFRGNTWSYSDPANSYLDHVITVRAGLPITLSILYLEIGWRLGLPLNGLALPGHFLVQYANPEGTIYIDPFNRGRLWSYSECETQVMSFYRNVTPALMQQSMMPPTRNAILTRMLRNLKSAYLERGDHLRALAASERIILLAPDDPQELRDRGLLRAQLGDIYGALEDFEAYGRNTPQSPDLPTIRKQARKLIELIDRKN